MNAAENTQSNTSKEKDTWKQTNKLVSQTRYTLDDVISTNENYTAIQNFLHSTFFQQNKATFKSHKTTFNLKV